MLRWKRSGTELRCYAPTHEKAATLFGCLVSEVEPAGWYSAIGNDIVTDDVSAVLVDNPPKERSHPDNRKSN